MQARLGICLLFLSLTACQLAGEPDFQAAYIPKLEGIALIEMQGRLATEVGVTQVNLNPDQFAQCTTVTLERRSTPRPGKGSGTAIEPGTATLANNSPAEIFELGVANGRCALRRSSTGKQIPLSHVSCSTHMPDALLP